MNATLEQPDTIDQPKPSLAEQAMREQQNEIFNYQMPRPCRGQSILWYPSGTTASQPEMAFVLKVGAKNIELQVASGLCHTAVRHITDPKLRLNQDQRENGAWDFTDEHKERRDLLTRLATLEATVKELEDLIASGKKK